MSQRSRIEAKDLLIKIIGVLCVYAGTFRHDGSPQDREDEDVIMLGNALANDEKRLKKLKEGEGT